MRDEKRAGERDMKDDRRTKGERIELGRTETGEEETLSCFATVERK